MTDEKRNQMTEKGNEENLSNVNQTEPVNFKEKDLINQINDLKNDITFLLQDNEEKDRKIKRYKSIIIELENQINIIKNGNEKELYELMKNE